MQKLIRVLSIALWFILFAIISIGFVFKENSVLRSVLIGVLILMMAMITILRYRRRKSM